MKKLKVTIFLILICYHYENLPAQSRKVFSFVSQESSPKEGIPYATVYVKELANGAAADHQGKCTLSIPKNGTYNLIVQALGYQKKEFILTVNKDTNVTFTLKEDALRMEAIVVTGTRTPKMLKDVPILTRLITAQDIQTVDVQNIKDVLETELPGLEFTSHGSSSNINMQGLGGKYILFLLDGERLAGETRDNVDYNRLDVSNIERIEIVKGAASALYGSSAIGGVVNIITKNASKPWQVNVHSRYGTHAMQQHGGTIGFKRAKFSSLTTGNYKYFKGYSLRDTEGASYIFDYETVVDTTKYTTNVKGYKDFSVNQKFVYTPLVGLKFTFKGGYYEHEDLGIAKNNKKNELYRGGAISFKTDWVIAPKQHLELGYNFDLYDKYDHFLTEELTGVKRRTYSNLQHSATALFHQLFNDRNRLTIGLEFMYDNLLTYQFMENKRYSSSNYVLFAQHDVTLWKKFSIVYGARLDYNTTFKPYLSPKLSLMYQEKGVSLRASYGGGFRAPSLKELYTNWDHQGMFRLMGSENLRPEKSHNASLSIEYTKNIFNVSATGFYTYILDQITTAWNETEDTAFYLNYGSAQVAGTEVNFQVETKFGLSVKACYGYTYSHSLDENGVNMSTTRPHSATLRVGYRYKVKFYRINPVIQGKVLSGLDMKSFSTSRQEYYTIRYPAYTTWKVILNQQFFDAITLQAGIDNVFGYRAKRQTFNSSLTSGRTYFVGLSIDLERLCQLSKKGDKVKK